MNEPKWSCEIVDGYYLFEATVSEGITRHYARHWITRSEFDGSADKKSLLIYGFEGMMNEFRKMALKYPGGNRFTAWPKKKYYNNSITCIQS